MQSITDAFPITDGIFDIKIRLGLLSEIINVSGGGERDLTRASAVQIDE